MPRSILRQPVKYIIQTQYFLYFAVMGLTLPYFNLYLSHIHLDGIQIGFLSGLRSALIMVVPMAWGLLADRLHARRILYIGMNIGATVIWMGYFWTTQFKWLAVIGLLHGIVFSPIIAFLETFSMEALGKEKKKYGLTRLWGSIAFILVVVGCGHLFDRIGIDILLMLVLAGSGLQALSSLLIPATSAPLHPSQHLLIPEGLRSKGAVVFLICGFLMLASHGGYYGFISIHLETLGYDKTFIGICWALASICEIGVMAGSQRIFSRFSLKSVLVFALIAASLRWLALSYFTSAAPILISQSLHALTYGTFHMASILTIDRFASDRLKTFAQTLNNSIGYGMGMTAGFLIAGYIYQQSGFVWMFRTSSLIALCGALILYRWGKIPADPEHISDNRV